MTDTPRAASVDGAPFLAEVDWRRPWLASVRESAMRIMRAGAWRDALNTSAANQGLRNHLGKPIHFVPQACLPQGTAYEAFISANGGVPTRDNLHDFFNALTWLTFSKIKRKLNALQADEIARVETQMAAGGPKMRGKVRDAATLFDENAALLIVTNTGLLDALRAHRWSEVFLDGRDAFRRECEVWVFGHALMEKLVHPYKAITAHAWPVIADASFFKLNHAGKIAWIDDMVAMQLTGALCTADFTPLPILGVPDWWEGQDAAFYADTSVFRPKKSTNH